MEEEVITYPRVVRVLYVGRRFDGKTLRYVFVPYNDGNFNAHENHKEALFFKKPLGTSAIVGTVYDIKEVKEGSYGNSGDNKPVYVQRIDSVELLDELTNRDFLAYKESALLASARRKVDSLQDEHINALRITYRMLPANQKDIFLGLIIKEITS